MRGILSAWLAACLLGGQTALPAAHEWRVARDEAGRHLDEPFSPRIAEAGGAASHRHHDENSCGVCPGVAQLPAAQDSGIGNLPAVSPPPLKLTADHALVPVAAASANASPRGPPALS